MSFSKSVLGKAPAVVPAVVPAVLCYEEPASPMPLEIEAAANTAAPPLDLQEPAANTATPPLDLNPQEEPVPSDSALETEAELQLQIFRQLQQLMLTMRPTEEDWLPVLYRHSCFNSQRDCLFCAGIAFSAIERCYAHACFFLFLIIDVIGIAVTSAATSVGGLLLQLSFSSLLWIV